MRTLGKLFCLATMLALAGCSGSSSSNVENAGPSTTKSVMVKQVNYMPSALDHSEGHIPRIRVILTLEDQSKLVLFNYENEVHKYQFVPNVRYKITYKGNGRLVGADRE